MDTIVLRLLENHSAKIHKFKYIKNQELPHLIGTHIALSPRNGPTFAISRRHDPLLPILQYPLPKSTQIRILHPKIGSQKKLSLQMQKLLKNFLRRLLRSQLPTTKTLPSQRARKRPLRWEIPTPNRQGSKNLSNHCT